MNKLIRKILRESDFDWTTDLPAEDDVVYLDLTICEPYWEYAEDVLEENPEWDCWNLYFYVPKQMYRDITRQYDLSGTWDEWNISSEEGSQFIDYFYNEGFDKKQKMD